MNHEYATLLKIDFLSQVLDSLEKDAVKDAVQTLQDIGRFDLWLSSMFVFEKAMICHHLSPQHC